MKDKKANLFGSPIFDEELLPRFHLEVESFVGDLVVDDLKQALKNFI